MKVLYVGYPKCGTKTMNVVFRTLGYSCYDNTEHIGYLGNAWRKVFEEGATPDKFRRMYSDVDTAVDTPVFHFWEEFLEAFPDLKLMVYYRPEEAWTKSALKQRDEIQKNRVLKVISMLSPTCQKYLRYSRMCSNALWGGDRHSWPWEMYSGLNEPNMLKLYRRHNLYLQQKAPKDRLHVVDFKDGWEPICKFLGKPVPGEPFPHANKAGIIMDTLMKEHPLFHKMKREALTSIAILVVLFSAFLFYCFGN